MIRGLITFNPANIQHLPVFFWSVIPLVSIRLVNRLLCCFIKFLFSVRLGSSLFVKAFIKAVSAVLSRVEDFSSLRRLLVIPVSWEYWP